MTWGFSLLGALLLLFPGFCAWLGLRSGSQRGYLSPVPDAPNSTYTLFVVLLGALMAHLAGAGVFAIQETYCRHRACLPVGVDPDVYKAILRHDTALAGSATGIAFSLLFFLGLSGLNGIAFRRIGGSTAFGDLVRPEVQGWIRTIAAGKTDPGKVVTAFVLTRTGYNGLFAAYEGIVQQLTMDDSQAITMIVLAGVDRFLVQIADDTMRRLDTDNRSMPLMQILAAEIANVAFDVFDLGEAVE